MGLLDALGSLTMAAGEELPGIARGVENRAQKEVNSTIGAAFEAARIKGDVPGMTDVFTRAQGGEYNIGSTQPSAETFNIMQTAITGFQDDDEEKELERLKNQIGLGGDIGKQATLALYKRNNPNATENELNAVTENYDQTQELETARQKKLAGLDAPKDEWELVSDKESNQPLYWQNPTTQEIKPVTGPGGEAMPPGTPDTAVTDQEQYLVNQVKRNPNILKTFKTDMQEQVINAFGKLGEDIPTALPQAAQTKIADFETSISELEGLDTYLNKPEVMENMGPWSGRWASLDPWNEDAKEAISKLKGITQVIGKALEGGVLRKEDEEKYKQILPNINDTTGTARRKLKVLLTRLQKAKAIYERNVNQGLSGQDAAASFDEVVEGEEDEGEDAEQQNNLPPGHQIVTLPDSGKTVEVDADFNVVREVTS